MHLGTIAAALVTVLMVELSAGQSQGVSLFPFVDRNFPLRRGARRRLVENVSLNFNGRQRNRLPRFTNTITIDPWYPFTSRQYAIREVKRLERIIEEARKNRPVYDFDGPLQNFLPLPIGERFKPSPFRDPRASRPQLAVGPLSPEIRYAGDLIRAKAAAGYYGDKPLFDF